MRICLSMGTLKYPLLHEKKNHNRAPENIWPNIFIVLKSLPC